MDVMLVISETCGGTVSRRVQCGKVTMKIGRRTKACHRVVSREDNVCNVALHVSGLYGVGGKISLPLLGGLGACECGANLSHFPGEVVPGSAGGLAAGFTQLALCHSKESPSLTVDRLRQQRRGMW